MKQRTLNKACGKKPTEAERFEKWLMSDRIGLGRCRRGSNAQQVSIYANLEDAASAPFEEGARISVLSGLYSSFQPLKALLAMKALCGMGRAGSEEAKEAFADLARKWIADEAIRSFNKDIWAKGVVLIINTAGELEMGGLKKELAAAAREDPHISFWRRAVKLGCEVL